MTEKILNVTNKEITWEHQMQAHKLDLIESLTSSIKNQEKLLTEIRDLLKGKTTKTQKK